MWYVAAKDGRWSSWVYEGTGCGNLYTVILIVKVLDWQVWKIAL